jgi:hypothetical protein
MFMRLPIPPICCNSFGSIALDIYCMSYYGFLYRFFISVLVFNFMSPIFLTITENFLYSSSRKATSSGLVPLPLATLTILESVSFYVQSNSSLVIESIMQRNLFILAVDSFSLPFGIKFDERPGIIPTT